MSTEATQKPFKQYVDANWSARTAFIHGAEVGTLHRKLLYASPTESVEDFVREENVENMMRLGEAFGRSVVGRPALEGTGPAMVAVSFGIAAWRILAEREAEGST